MGHQLFLMPLFYARHMREDTIPSNYHYHKIIILIICFAVHNYY